MHATGNYSINDLAELFSISSITVAHDWEGFGGVAGDGNARPGPDAFVSIATTVP